MPCSNITDRISLMVAADPQYHPSQRVFSVQSPMRLSGFPQRIARRDRHANSAVGEVTIQLVKFMRIRDRIEGTYAERGPRLGNGFDAVRVHDASLRPHEVETPLEFLASGERKYPIQSVGRERPELLDGCRTPRVEYTMSAELSDETGRRRAGCGRDDVGPSLNRELNRHRPDGTRRTEDQHGVSSPQSERVDALECG